MESEKPIRIALDVTAALERPLTGVGYAALHQVQALASLRPGLDLRLFGTRARGVSVPAELNTGFTKRVTLANARRLKTALWSRWNWPPIEWFCGETDIAHGLFHLLPASSGAKRVVTVHDLIVYRYPETHTKSTVRLHRHLLEHAARYADALIAVSESCRHDLLEFLGASPERVFVVPNGVCLEEFREPPDEKALHKLKEQIGSIGGYWLCIGTIEPRKNLKRLLTAYRRILDRFEDCPSLLFAGHRGWLSEPVFQTIRDLRLEQKVKHAGYLSRTDVILLLKGAAACLYPSLYEGFGLPVLEAMAAGVPVLTSNVSAIPEVIGACGVLTDPEDVDALESGMETLLTNPAVCRQMAREAQERAQAFSWEASATRLVDVYRKLQSF